MAKERLHFLLETALTYERGARDLAPPGCHYDLVAGAWIVNGTDTLFVETAGPFSEVGPAEVFEYTG